MDSKYCLGIELGSYLTPILAKYTRKIVKVAILDYFDGFSARIWVKYYPSSILRPYSESPHQGDPFRPQYESEFCVFMFYFMFLASPSLFSKIITCARTKKAVLLGEKWHCFVIHIPWHGVSSENLENVEFGAKWSALMVRSGQPRSGQVMQG